MKVSDLRAAFLFSEIESKRLVGRENRRDIYNVVVETMDEKTLRSTMLQKDELTPNDGK